MRNSKTSTIEIEENKLDGKLLQIKTVDYKINKKKGNQFKFKYNKY